MSFFIPWLAIGVGSSFCAWGVHQLISKNDSADEAAQKVWASLPDYVQKHVKHIELTEKGFKIDFRSDTPKEIEDEVQEQIKKA